MSFPFTGVALKQLFSKPSTERYPFVKKEAPAGYRGKIIFHPDRCISCGMCMRVCSPGAITRTVEKLPDDQGDQITFEFNMGSCTFCQMCSDFCSKEAIEMSPEYSMIAIHGAETLVTDSFIKKKPAPKAIPPKAETKEPAPDEEACPLKED